MSHFAALARNITEIDPLWAFCFWGSFFVKGYFAKLFFLDLALVILTDSLFIGGQTIYCYSFAIDVLPTITLE